MEINRVCYSDFDRVSWVTILTDFIGPGHPIVLPIFIDFLGFQWVWLLYFFYKLLVITGFTGFHVGHWVFELCPVILGFDYLNQFNPPSTLIFCSFKVGFILKLNRRNGRTSQTFGWTRRWRHRYRRWRRSRASSPSTPTLRRSNGTVPRCFRSRSVPVSFFSLTFQFRSPPDLDSTRKRSVWVFSSYCNVM